MRQAMLLLASVEPSSTKSNSQLPYVCANTLSTASGRKRPSLRKITTTETSGNSTGRDWVMATSCLTSLAPPHERGSRTRPSVDSQGGQPFAAGGPGVALGGIMVGEGIASQR